MNKLICGLALVASFAGSAHVALFGLIPTTNSIRIQALRAGHNEVEAHQIAHRTMNAVSQGLLNRHGVAAAANTGNIQTGLSVARQTRWLPRE